MNNSTEQKQEGSGAQPPVVMPNDAVTAVQDSSDVQDKDDSHVALPNETQQPQEEVLNRSDLHDVIIPWLRSKISFERVLIFVLMGVVLLQWLQKPTAHDAAAQDRKSLVLQEIQKQQDLSEAELTEAERAESEDRKQWFLHERESRRLAFEHAKSEVNTNFESLNEDIEESIKKFANQSFKTDFQNVPYSMLRGIVKDRNVVRQLVAHNVSVGKLMFNSSTDGLSNSALDRKLNHLKDALVIIQTEDNEIFGAFLSLVSESKDDTHFTFLVEDYGQVKLVKHACKRSQKAGDIFRVKFGHNDIITLREDGTAKRGGHALGADKDFKLAKMEAYEVFAQI